MRLSKTWKRFAHRFRGGDRAATLIEYSLVILVLLGLIAGILEIARFMAIKGLLNQAAQRAVNLAARVPAMQFESSAPAADYKEYIKCRGLAMQDGLSLALGNMMSQGGSPQGAAKLVPFEDIDLVDGTG